MIAFLLIPVFLGLGIYGYSWLIRWLTACSPVFKNIWIRIILALIYLYCIGDMYIAFFMEPSRVERALKLFGNYWYGFTLYSMMILIVADLIRVILKHTKIGKTAFFKSRKTFVISGLCICALILGVCIYGGIHARQIYTVDYDVEIKKDAGELESLDVVLLGDLHMGYNIGCDHIQQMVDKVNAANPDLIVIAGDIFDNSYDALEDPERLLEMLKSMQAKYGVYVVYGNHDIQEKIIGGFTFGGNKTKKMADERMDQFVEDCGWINLRDEGVMIADSIYLYGRPDYERLGRGIDVRKTPDEITKDMDHTKPIIVFEHEPVELQELADAGVDMDLCGHTHDGQMFPLTISNDIIWENGGGLYMKDNMISIVTPGIGLYGPYMRVGTDAEVSNIHITFTK